MIPSLQGRRRKAGACVSLLTLGICLVWLVTSFAPWEATLRTGYRSQLLVRSAGDGITVQTQSQFDPYIVERGFFTDDSVTVPYLSITLAFALLSASLIIWPTR